LEGRLLPALPIVRLPFFVFLSPFPIVWFVKGLAKITGALLREADAPCSNSQPGYVDNQGALTGPVSKWHGAIKFRMDGLRELRGFGHFAQRRRSRMRRFFRRTIRQGRCMTGATERTRRRSHAEEARVDPPAP
jgi:hypothetical protein